MNPRTGKQFFVTFYFAAIIFFSLYRTAVSKDAVGTHKPATSALKKIEQLKPLTRDGKQFLPIAAYGAPKNIELRLLHEAGWNNVLEEELGDASVEAIRQRLSEFNNAGFVGIVGFT